MQREKFKKALTSKKYQFNAFREGYCRPFIAEPEYMVVKIKRECLGEMLSDIQATSPDVSGVNFRPGQGMINFVSKVMINSMIRLWNLISRSPEGEENKLKVVDMRRIKPSTPFISGWLMSKVLFIQNDYVHEGREEL